MEIGPARIARRQPPEAGQPGQGALDQPAMVAQAFAALPVAGSVALDLIG
jgi:hypothetical protein